MLHVTRYKNYIELSVPDITDRLELLRLSEEYGVLRAWSDLHTEYNSSLVMIDPETWFVGLTSNPYIVAFEKDVLELEELEQLEVHGDVYVYDYYMTSDPVERLIVGDTVKFSLGIKQDDDKPIVFGRT